MKLSSPPTRYAFTSVIAATMKYGPTRVSRIAYELDMPVETCRYYLKRFHNAGFRFLPVVDYKALGLQPCILFIRFSKKLDPVKRKNFLRWLDTVYVVYRTALGNELEYYIETVPPKGDVSVLKKMMEMLLDVGVLENFNLSEIVDGYYRPEWIRLYDFTKNCWSEAIELDIPKILISRTDRISNFDQLDLQLISYLEENPTVKMIDISQKLSIPPQLISYHRERHVDGGRLITGYVPYRRTRHEDFRIQIIATHRQEPITDYLHYAISTGDNIRYLRAHIPVNIELSLEYAHPFTVNPMDIVRFTVPVEHFSDKKWTKLSVFTETLEKIIGIV